MTDPLDPLLAPLARLLVARGVMFPDLAERLKTHYVQAAQDLAEGKITDSRLSVMTGLQRRDIARLRQAEHPEPRPNHLTRLVALWQTRAAYAPGDQPLALPRSGPAPSFEALARDVRRDVHPRTMLDTLETAGTVRTDPDSDTVHLLETAYVPLGGSEEQLAYLADNVGDHLAAATANVMGATPAFFDRALHYSGLTEDQARTLAQRFHSGQMELLEQLNRDAAGMKADAPGGAATRIRAGGYLFTETERGDPE